MIADYEYKCETGTVRFHYGKLSPAELQTTFERAAVNFYKSIKPQLVRLETEDGNRKQEVR